VSKWRISVVENGEECEEQQSIAEASQSTL
jgi:hypothetical protein